jgi:hypothetical protein
MTMMMMMMMKFPRTNEAKIKEEISVGPQGKQPFQVPDFKNKLNATERRAWYSFQNVRIEFFGK